MGSATEDILLLGLRVLAAGQTNMFERRSLTHERVPFHSARIFNGDQRMGTPKALTALSDGGNRRCSVESGVPDLTRDDEAARSWAALLDSGTFNEADRCELDKWLDARPRRLAALIRARGEFSPEASERVKSCRSARHLP